LPYIEEKAAFDEWDLNEHYGIHPESVRNTVVASYLCPTRHAAENAVVESRTYNLGTLPCGCSGFTYRVGGALSDYAGNHGDGRNGVLGWKTDFIYGGNDHGVITTSRPRCTSDGRYAIGWIDKVRMKQIADGSSKTILAGEKHIRQQNLFLYPDDAPAYDGEFLFGSARVAGPGYPLGGGAQDHVTDFVSFGSWHPSGCTMAFCDGRVEVVTTSMDTVALGKLANRADRQPGETPGRP
jgi:prepilin-type processing-associated H-X9-DG protein